MFMRNRFILKHIILVEIYCIDMIIFGWQESADNVSPDSTSPSKDDLLEEACKKYEETTRLCPTLHDVCMRFLSTLVVSADKVATSVIIHYA